MITIINYIFSFTGWTLSFQEAHGRQVRCLCHTSHANRTTLHAFITMDGVYAGFAWSKKPVITMDGVYAGFAWSKKPDITMDGVYAGFAWSKNLSNYGF